MVVKVLAAMTLLILLSACRVGERRYEGKEVCQLISNQDVENVFGEAFNPGQRMGLLNDGNSHIGSSCDFETLARNPSSTKDYKFRVAIEVRTVEPSEADIVALRKHYETEMYNEKLLYHKVQDLPGVADGAFGAFDPYQMFKLFAIFSPDVQMSVSVYHVVEGEAVARALAVARIVEKRLRDEGVAAKPR